MVLFRVRLNGSWFEIHKEVLNFHDWTLLLSWTLTITGRNKNQLKNFQWICDIQVIWKLSYLNLLLIIIFELFEHWTILIVFSNYRKTWSKLHLFGVVLQNQSCSPAHLSVCPAVCGAFFSGSTQWILLIFCMSIFCHIY